MKRSKINSEIRHMEELIQEDLTEKDIVKKAIDQEKKKKNNNDSLQTDTDTGEDSAK